MTGLQRNARNERGSVLVIVALFMASGIASFVTPDTASVRNIALVNVGTFVGAVCFLIGALELLPERTRRLA